MRSPKRTPFGDEGPPKEPLRRTLLSPSPPGAASSIRSAYRDVEPPRLRRRPPRSLGDTPWAPATPSRGGWGLAARRGAGGGCAAAPGVGAPARPGPREGRVQFAVGSGDAPRAPPRRAGAPAAAPGAGGPLPALALARTLRRGLTVPARPPSPETPERRPSFCDADGPGAARALSRRGMLWLASRHAYDWYGRRRSSLPGGDVETVATWRGGRGPAPAAPRFLRAGDGVRGGARGRPGGQQRETKWCL